MEEDKKIWEKFLLYNNNEKQKREREETLEELTTENPNIEDILEYYLEADNADNTRLTIDHIEYPPRILKDFEERKKKNLPISFPHLQVEFYLAHDIPCHLKDIANWPNSAKRYFIDIVNQQILGKTT